MKTNKLSYVLFSLVMIAALVFAAIPMTPAHAMPTGTNTSISATNAQVSSVSILVCKHVSNGITNIAFQYVSATGFTRPQPTSLSQTKSGVVN
jgi:hypothetical protein